MFNKSFYGISLLVLFTLSCSSLGHTKMPASKSINISERLEKIKITDLEGHPLNLKDFVGKPVFLNFWATWCTPCVEEMPLLNAFFLENKAKSWQMIGLAIDQPSAVKRFLGQHPVEYTIGMAGLEGTELMKNLGNPTGGLPFTLVLNAQGQVQMRKLGKLTESDIRSWA